MSDLPIAKRGADDSVTDGELQETRRFWDTIARDWQIQVGEAGDRNRMLNSDPVLWEFAGDVAGLRVVDAGCGPGYLSKQLADRGARVTGIDFSGRMIEIARRQYPGVDFRVDSCSTLASLSDGECDLLVSNYVLMDTPDLESSVAAFHRVLRPEGAAVLVFSHPCFPAGRAKVHEDGGIDYPWPFPYFERRKCFDPPWAHFTSDFVWFHRPLSDYWKAFTDAGFEVTGFEEPRLMPEREHLARDAKELARHRSRPYSVAFRLEKR